MSPPDLPPRPYHEPGAEPASAESSAAEVDAEPVDTEGSAAPAAITPEERELVAEPPTLCLNCGARLPGAYCPRCGQRDQTLRIPVHRFVWGGLTELFGIDGRVWRTYGTLLFKPGRLTAEYFKGRRQRSLSPLRVYIASTLLFFVLVSLIDPVGRMNSSFGGRPDGRSADSLVVVAEELAVVEAAIASADSAVASYAARVRDTTAAERARLAAARVEAVSDSVAEAAGDVEGWDDVGWSDDAGALDEAIEDAIDALDEPPSARERLGLRIERAILQALPSDSLVRLGDIEAARAQLAPAIDNRANLDLPGWMPRSESVERFTEARDRDEQRAAVTALGRSAIGQLPTALFLLLPVFALLLKAVYVRRGWYYSEHLVFGLHIHAAAFVVLTVALVVSFLSNGAGVYSEGGPIAGLVVSLLLLYIPVYYLVASWRVYGQGVLKTLAKSVVVGFVYALALIILGTTLSILLVALER